MWICVAAGGNSKLITNFVPNAALRRRARALFSYRYQMATKKNENSRPRRYVGAVVRWMWILFVVAVVLAALFLILVYNGVIGYMPPVEQLKNPQDRFASVVYSSDGEELGRYYRATGNRVYADFDEISPAVVDALISTEDARFEDHSGIDLRAMDVWQ